VRRSWRRPHAGAARTVDPLERSPDTHGPLQGAGGVDYGGPRPRADHPVRFISNRSSGKMGLQCTSSTRSGCGSCSRQRTRQPVDASRRAQNRRESAADMLNAVLGEVVARIFFISTARWLTIDRQPRRTEDQENFGSDGFEYGSVRRMCSPRSRPGLTGPFVVGLPPRRSRVEQHARGKL